MNRRTLFKRAVVAPAAVVGASQGSGPIRAWCERLLRSMRPSGWFEDGRGSLRVEPMPAWFFDPIHGEPDMEAIKKALDEKCVLYEWLRDHKERRVVFPVDEKGVRE